MKENAFNQHENLENYRCEYRFLGVELGKQFYSINNTTDVT